MPAPAGPAAGGQRPCRCIVRLGRDRVGSIDHTARPSMPAGRACAPPRRCSRRSPLRRPAPDDRARRSAAGWLPARCRRPGRPAGCPPGPPPGRRSTPRRRGWPRWRRAPAGRTGTSAGGRAPVRSAHAVRGSTRRARAGARRGGAERPAPEVRRGGPGPPERPPARPRRRDRRGGPGPAGWWPAAASRPGSQAWRRRRRAVRRRRRRRSGPVGRGGGGAGAQRALQGIELSHREGGSFRSRLRASWTLRRAASSLVSMTTPISA